MDEEDPADPSDRFAPGVNAWRDRIGLVRDAVRQELVTRQVQAHLPPAGSGARPRALDAGCGQGTQVIRLARLGYDVVGIDLDETLLGEAHDALDGEAPAVRDRVHLRHGDLLRMADDLVGPFDAVCCHGVVMYLPSLADAIQALASVTRPGGVLSILTRNRDGIAMRAGMSGDWAGALSGFDAPTYANRLGITDVRADTPEEVTVALDEAQVRTEAWYGVRLFTDHWPDSPPPGDFATLVRAEAEAGGRDPYRRLAALTHTIGIRRTDPRRSVVTRPAAVRS